MDQGAVTPRDSQSRQPGIASRFFGIIFSPKVTFESVVGTPHWLSMLALVTVIMAIFVGGFLSTEVGQFSVVVHSAVIGSLQQIFTWPLNYFREFMTSPTTLAVFLPMLDEGTYLFRFLGVIELFLIWWIVVLSIGLSVLYKSKTRNIALGIFALYGIIALAVAAFTGGS